MDQLQRPPLSFAGLGLEIQQGSTARQTVPLIEEVAIGTAAVVASQSLGGAVFDPVGNAMQQNHLLDTNQEELVPGADIVQYDNALRKAFVEVTPMTGLAFVVILGVEWKSVHGEGEGREAGRGETGRMPRHKMSHRGGGA